jgi:hypothetical protein
MAKNRFTHSHLFPLMGGIAMIKTLAVFLLIGSMISLSACQNEEEKFAERTTKAGRYDASGALQIENERALKMEQDLIRRHRFYQALKGTYEGVIQTQEGNYNVRLILVPSLHPYPQDPNRTRTVSEVEQDLTNLYFNAQVIQWNPANTLSAVGCRVKEIRPNMVTGEIFITSEDCPNFYALRLSGPGIQEEPPSRETPSGETPLEKAQNIAQAIIQGNVISVSELYAQVQPTTNALKYEFLVTRMP